MSKQMPFSPDRDASGASSPVADRVRNRVAAAQAELDARRPRGSRRGSRENPALWRVFRDLGESQRDHRRSTGELPWPEVRDAANSFQRTPTLDSLVAVATLLDRRGLPI